MGGLRFVARAATIAWFLFFRGFVWFFGWLARLVSFRSKASRQAWFAQCLLALLRDLGATFIKVGQIMSTRPDLLPPHIIHALETLQDRVGPFAFKHVERTLREDFGSGTETLFAEFDPVPTATASVAQVHKARLHDGTAVAVKVRRPRIERIAELDLSFMRLVARMIALIPSYRLLAPLESVNEFGRGLAMQLDLSREAESNRRFAASFAGDPDVFFPKLHPELCSRRVLTMEWIDGVKVLEFEKGGADPARLARIGFRVLLKMVFQDGFVHADLHPGNIFVTPGNHKVCLLDLGLTGELDDLHRRAFAQYFAAWASCDGVTMAKIMHDLSPSAGKVPDYPAFERAVSTFVARYQGKKLGEVEVATVAYEMMEILRTHRVRVNATFTMCNIAIAITEGIGKQLDPSIDLMAEALPFFATLDFGAPVVNRS